MRRHLRIISQSNLLPIIPMMSKKIAYLRWGKSFVVFVWINRHSWFGKITSKRLGVTSKVIWEQFRKILQRVYNFKRNFGEQPDLLKTYFVLVIASINVSKTSHLCILFHLLSLLLMRLKIFFKELFSVFQLGLNLMWFWPHM